jgi:hypothetical protein
MYISLSESPVIFALVLDIFVPFRQSEDSSLKRIFTFFLVFVDYQDHRRLWIWIRSNPDYDALTCSTIGKEMSTIIAHQVSSKPGVSNHILSVATFATIVATTVLLSPLLSFE